MLIFFFQFVDIYTLFCIDKICLNLKLLLHYLETAELAQFIVTMNKRIVQLLKHIFRYLWACVVEGGMWVTEVTCKQYILHVMCHMM